MIKTVYASYGVLAHEKEPVYCSGILSEVYDEVEVEIPDELIADENNLDELILTLDGREYLLHEVLSNRGDKPVLSWYANGHHKHLDLEIRRTHAH